MKIPSPVQRKRCRIEIIPLIDIMFFLLASFMMVSLQMERTQNIKVNLPGAARAAPGRLTLMLWACSMRRLTIMKEASKKNMMSIKGMISMRHRLPRTGEGIFTSLR